MVSNRRIARPLLISLYCDITFSCRLEWFFTSSSANRQNIKNNSDWVFLKSSIIKIYFNYLIFYSTEILTEWYQEDFPVISINCFLFMAFCTVTLINPLLVLSKVYITFHHFFSYFLKTSKYHTCIRAGLKDWGGWVRGYRPRKYFMFIYFTW